jgi:hypothetical protein
MEPRIIRSDDFYKRRIAQLEAELRRAELGRQYAEESSRRAWALSTWPGRPTSDQQERVGRARPAEGTRQSAEADRPTP